VFDQNVLTTGTIWEQAMARPRTALPWILISDGVRGYEGPLPATITETLVLLRKFGG